MSVQAARDPTVDELCELLDSVPVVLIDERAAALRGEDILITYQHALRRWSARARPILDAWKQRKESAMSEQHSTGKPDLGAPAMTINDEHGPAAPGDDLSALSTAIESAIELEPMCRWFRFGHLPPHLQEVSSNFASLAILIATKLPRNPERTVALRKLLEAKDAAVRAKLT